MNRTKFYKEVTTKVKGVDTLELDFLYNTLSNFEIIHTPIYYRTDASDVGRPDLISFENYGTVRYWWIICIVNKIENPITGIAIGDILVIPHLSDIYAFYKRFKIR